MTCIFIKIWDSTRSRRGRILEHTGEVFVVYDYAVFCFGLVYNLAFLVEDLDLFVLGRTEKLYCLYFLHCLRDTRKWTHLCRDYFLHFLDYFWKCYRLHKIRVQFRNQHRKHIIQSLLILRNFLRYLHNFPKILIKLEHKLRLKILIRKMQIMLRRSTPMNSILINRNIYLILHVFLYNLLIKIRILLKIFL